ncbi:putative ankyrin repeat protein RF_0381 [Saccostrea echinata]|uniref:putative ankyrin repeat protein RF_0381 n=1 Tax=Saccostrea echinata TaxID=191078 RepID=UPI002A838FB9|nr:putative ankyrin repeat protein RF_0381 [Saccostrea echinata]
MKVVYSTLHMLEAVINGDITALQNVLKSGIDVNVLDKNGEPLLFTPIVNGDMDTLKVLLAYADVNMTTDDCRTALMIATEMNDIDIVKKLIKSGADVNRKDNSGKTPLLIALEDGNFKIAEYLIKHGSDVNVVDNLGQSALYLVATGEGNDCTKIVKILLSCGYVLKDSDNWLCPEDLISNAKFQSKYFKLMQKVNNSLKAISKCDIIIPVGS